MSQRPTQEASHTLRHPTNTSPTVTSTPDFAQDLTQLVHFVHAITLATRAASTETPSDNNPTTTRPDSASPKKEFLHRSRSQNSIPTAFMGAKRRTGSPPSALATTHPLSMAQSKRAGTDPNVSAQHSRIAQRTKSESQISTDLRSASDAGCSEMGETKRKARTSSQGTERRMTAGSTISNGTSSVSADVASITNSVANMSVQSAPTPLTQPPPGAAIPLRPGMPGFPAQMYNQQVPYQYYQYPQYYQYAPFPPPPQAQQGTPQSTPQMGPSRPPQQVPPGYPQQMMQYPIQYAQGYFTQQGFPAVPMQPYAQGPPSFMSNGTMTSMASASSPSTTSTTSFSHNAGTPRSPKNSFPHPEGMSLEATITWYRERMRSTPAPSLLLAYAKYLISIIPLSIRMEPSPKVSRRKVAALIHESTKTLKKLQAVAKDSKSQEANLVAAEGMVFLAECYGNGTEGFEVDHEKAFTLYLQASKMNHPAATYRVAVCYEVGAGPKRDPARSNQFYRKAAALGDPPAMYKTGLILLHGYLNQQKNPREAIIWLKRAANVADAEHPHALHELGLVYENPSVPNVVADPSYAKELFTKSANLGYAPSQYKMGLCYEQDKLGCGTDARRSIAWYTRAAEKGHPEAELALSGWYLTGAEGVLQQSDREAYLWARKAADKGLSTAEYAVGYYIEMGIGIKPDIEESRRWYIRASEQGNKRAMQRLTELKMYGKQYKGSVPSHIDRQNARKDGECSIM